MNIKDYIKGWLVGDFDESIIRSKDIEVGIKYYKEGDSEQRHVHKLITEYTIVVDGIIEMNNKLYYKGDIVKIDPGQSTDFMSFNDSITLVIKTPSIPTDKHLV